MGQLRDLLFGPPPRRRIPADIPDSPIDWNPGDTAITRLGYNWSCVDTGRSEHGPAKGQRCLVTAVKLVEGIQFLQLAGFDGWFAACSFTRLDPGALEVDEKVIEQLPKPKHARRLKESV